MTAPMFTHDQARDIKMLGVASLLGGSSLAALKMFKPKPVADIGATSGTFINIPVPYQEDVRRGGVTRSRAYKSNRVNSLYDFDPLDGREVDEDNIEKKSYVTKNWVNPYYAPAMTLAAAAPAWVSYHLLNNAIQERDKGEGAAELARAKSVFANAMITAQAGNIKKKSTEGDSELNGDLDALADMHSFVKNTRPPSLGGAPSGTEKQSSIMDDIFSMDFGRSAANLFNGYLGATAALGLATTGASTIAGYRAAKKSDSDALESEKYLNEYMRRRSLEGSPVHAVPIPVKFKKNKDEILAPRGMEQRINTEEI